MKRLFACLAIVCMLILLAGCNTELDNAISTDDVALVKKLLSEGAPVNGKDPGNFGPLHFAALYGTIESARVLLENGADINLKSAAYGTPLMVATYYGHKNFVKFLLEKGANPALTDAGGKTALNYAEEYQFDEIAQILKKSPPPAVKAAPVVERDSAGSSVQAKTVAPADTSQAKKESAAAAAADTSQAKKVAATDTSEAKEGRITMAVFTFESANVEASSYSLEISNLLIKRLKTISSIQLTDRRDLEDFLSANDLRQNNNLENIIQIGAGLGLGYIISGRVEKKDAMIIAHCQLITIGDKKVILSRVIRAFGYANMEKEVATFGEDVVKALSR